MSAAFTPGPWVLAFDHHRTEVRAAAARTGRRIASTFLTPSPVSASENEANARLIAAAPEMYDDHAAAIEALEPLAALARLTQPDDQIIAGQHPFVVTNGMAKRAFGLLDRMRATQAKARASQVRP